MTDDFESNAHDYLLGRMGAARRAAFEAELETNPMARVALKEIADALAGFAREAAAPEPMNTADHRAVLDTILAQANAGAHPRPARQPIAWGRFLWPAAALFLLALNLLDFERPVYPTPGRRTTATAEKKSAVSETPERSPVTPTRGSSGEGTSDQPPKLPPPVPTTRGDGRTAEESGREIERLRGNVAELQQAQDKLRAEYESLVRRLAEQGLNRDLNRLTTMELVDAGAFARGERRGLVMVARGILTEPGIVVPAEPPPDPLGTSATRPPYAWSVYDEQEHRGFLNLYRLPAVPADQSLQIWVRLADTQAFQNVGEVPSQLYGRDGTVQYALPPAASAPAGILVTIEPRAAVPAIPSGPVVVRGP